MRKSSASLNLTLFRSLSGRFERLCDRIWSALAPWLSHRTAHYAAGFGVSRIRRPAVGDTGPSSTLSCTGESFLPSLRQRLRTMFAFARGSRAAPARLVLHRPPGGGAADGILQRLARRADCKLQAGLIQEALEMLDPKDARVIRSRLLSEPDGSVSQGSPAGDCNAVACYAVAVDRFSQRLAWVASQELLGIPPTRRRAMGCVRFFGLTAQQVACRLRLPVEVVEYWASQNETPP